MIKLLKCPECNKHLTYLTTSNECTEYEHVHINDVGDFVTTESNSNRQGAETYVCPKCDFESPIADNFIAEMKCNCEHLESSIEKYDGYDIEMCQHCGLVLSNEISSSELIT